MLLGGHGLLMHTLAADFHLDRGLMGNVQKCEIVISQREIPKTQQLVPSKPSTKRLMGVSVVVGRWGDLRAGAVGRISGAAGSFFNLSF